jgi:hypothetical protein
MLRGVSYAWWTSVRRCYTCSASLEASLSSGIIKRKKKRERMANPLAVRVWAKGLSSGFNRWRGVIQRLRGPKQKWQARRV